MKPASLLRTLLLLLTLSTIYGCQSAVTDEVSNSVELSFDTTSINVPVHELPELEEFLASVEPADRQVEWERVQTSAFSSPTGVIYGDIRYNCGTKLCDHLWLQIKDDQRRTFDLPASNASIFVNHAFSPKETYLALLLGRNEGTELVRHQLLILRTDEFRAAAVQGEPVALSEQAVSSDFAFPILDLEWMDDQTLKIAIPDTEDKTRTLLLRVS